MPFTSKLLEFKLKRKFKVRLRLEDKICGFLTEVNY